jgi:superfamily II DNA or RNA helicase
MTTLSYNGIVINKNILTKNDIDNIKLDLTVMPICNGQELEDDQFEIFREHDNNLIIPKFYINNLNLHLDLIPQYIENKINLSFIGKLRPHQKIITKKSIKHLKKFGGGIISVGCGSGKTVMALYIAYKLKLRTLIVVHKSFLQEQWIERITQFFSNASVGYIRQNKVEPYKDFVVGMVHSISMRDYDPEIFKGFGMVIYDECHHYGSRVFSNALFKTGAKYVLGLSATPERNDGLTKILHWYMGDFIHKEPPTVNKQVAVKVFKFKANDPKNPFFQTVKMMRKIKKNGAWSLEEQVNITKMITNVCQIPERTDFIIHLINILRTDPDRKIMVIGWTISFIEELKQKTEDIINLDIANGILEENEITVCQYTGKTTPFKRKEAELYGDIIFASYSMAHEGLDIERLNTIILVTPKKDVIQTIGRIMRKQTETHPLIIDIADNLPVFIGQSRFRQKIYKDRKYDIQKFDHTHDINLDLLSQVNSHEDSLDLDQEAKPKFIKFDNTQFLF